MAELCEILKKSDVPFAPILFLYTDGGPNHRLTYISVTIQQFLQEY